MLKSTHKRNLTSQSRSNSKINSSPSNIIRTRVKPTRTKSLLTSKRFCSTTVSTDSTTQQHQHSKTDITSTPSSTTSSTSPTDSQDQIPNIRSTLAKDPIARFNARNTFIEKRHLHKDHLIHTHHNDIRIFACNLTNTLRTAVEKHKLNEIEAEVWGGYAAGTALYAGLLRGDDRVIMEAFLNNKDEQTNHIYVEAFAVGEIRGFATVKTPDVDPDTSLQHPGEGVIRITKALYQHKRKFQSILPAKGDPMNDWSFVYSQSEQIPTYVQTETIVRTDPDTNQVIVDFCGASLVQVIGGDSTLTERQRILTNKPLKRLEDENDDQYVKRVQLFEYQQRIVDQDMPAIVQKYGAAGYVSLLCGTDPETLGHPTNIHNIGNVEKQFDWEIFERSLLQSALREKPLVNVVNTDNDGPVTEALLQKDGKFQYQFEYRPLQFFCRCYQTDTHTKLTSLPRDLLTTLLEDEVVTFTCDFCALEDEIQRVQVQGAIAELDEKFAQQQQQQSTTEGQSQTTNNITDANIVQDQPIPPAQTPTH